MYEIGAFVLEIINALWVFDDCSNAFVVPFLHTWFGKIVIKSNKERHKEIKRYVD